MSLSLRPRPPPALIAALIAFLLAAVAAGGVIWRLEKYRLEQWRARASAAAGDHAYTLQRNIEHAMSAAQVLATLVRQGKGTVANFDEIAGPMLPLYPGVAELALVPGGVIRDVVPLAGNEKAVGFDLLQDPAQRKEAYLARDSGTLTLAGPLNLIQGGVGVVGRLPVFLDDDQGTPRFWGFTLAMMRLPALLQAARVAELTEQGFAWELWRMPPEGQQRQIIAAALPAMLVEPVQEMLHVPNATWALSVAPVKGWGDPLGLSLKAALGMLFSLLLGYMAKLLVEAKTHEKGLEALVAERTAEVSAREADLNYAQSIARVGSWWLDLVARRMYGSAETMRILGVSGGGAISYKAFLNMVHADDREAVDLATHASLKGAPYDLEYRVMVGGATRWVHSSAELTFAADGKLSKALGTIQDITERKQTDMALRQSEERYRILTDLSSDWYWEQDGNLRFCAMSKPNAGQIEIEPDTFLGKTRREAPGVRWDEPQLAALEAIVEARQPFRDFEIGRTYRDGPKRYVQMSGEPMFDAAGNFSGYRGVGKDITERKRREQDLMRFRLAMDASADAIYLVDRASMRFIDFNAAACAMRGQTREELLALGPEGVLLTPRAELERAYDEVIAGAGAALEPVEMLRQRQDGSQVWIEFRRRAVRSDAGWTIVTVVRDITERKRADEALRAAEEQFRGLVEQSIAGIYIVQDDKFVYANPRFAEILGYASAEELMGRDALLSVAEKDRDAVQEKTQLWPAGEVFSVSVDFVAVRKDGAMIEVGMHCARAQHKGRPAVIGLMQDISEKKRAEELIQSYLAQLQTAFMSSVKVATALSELRDPYTAGHERRVAEVAAAIGAELGLDARRQEGLRVAGYLHDIGKITIPVEILSKPGKLSPIEFQLIQGHSQSSYDVLKNVEFPWPVAEAVLQHHERMDGSGYPQGLKGEAILLDARILAVADVIEAMSSHRPYRHGLGIEKALAEIESGRGSIYDADVANACLHLFREKGYAIPE